MRLSDFPIIAALGLAGTLASAPAAYASAPPNAERPADQQRSASSQSAIERERRYAGLTLGDAIRQSLIDDDLEFAFTTMSALSQTAGEGAGARYFAGVRAFARGDFADATESLKEADSEDMMVASVRAWSLVGQGKAAEAATSWDSYGDSGRKPFYATYRALLAEHAGQTEMALRQYRIAESTGELLFAKDLAKRYAVLLVKANKQRDALRMYDEIFGEEKSLNVEQAAFRQGLVSKRPLALDPITPRNAVSGLMSNYASAGILVRMMRPDAPDAPDSSTDAPARPSATPPDPDALFVSDALTFRTALLVDPSNVSARFSLADMFTAMDEDEAAKKMLEGITSGARVNQARMALAGVYNSLETPKQGIDVLNAIPEAQRDADWWDRMGDLLIARGQYSEALVAVQRSVALAKGKGEWAEDVAQLSLANALTFVDKQAEAIEIARALVAKLEPRNPIRGAAASLLTLTPATKAIGQEAARVSLNAFGADGRSKVAVGSVLARDPATRTEGVQLIRDGLAEFPRSPIMMNALGYTLVTHNIDLDEGYRLLQKALDARPSSGAIMDSLGLANYKLGNLDEAQRLMEGAVALRIDAPDPEIYDNLGDVYWHQGRRDEARAQWRRAKEIGGAYEERGNLDGKIRDGLTTPPPTRRDVPVLAEPGSV
jgi:tetratricopeptide (TPR) repeat protein